MTNEQITNVSESEALDYLDDMLTWWRRRGRPEMRARARKAQQIVTRLRREQQPQQHQEVA